MLTCSVSCLVLDRQSLAGIIFMVNSADERKAAGDESEQTLHGDAADCRVGR